MGHPSYNREEFFNFIEKDFSLLFHLILLSFKSLFVLICDSSKSLDTLYLLISTLLNGFRHHLPFIPLQLFK